jgi:glycerophosphoryl diester phosphodiesterase
VVAATVVPLPELTKRFLVRTFRPALTACLIAVTAIAATPALDQALLLDNAWLEYDGVFNSAHRGGAFEVPENTLFGFRESMLRGADQLETDVAITKDGEVVVIHDTSVNRTTDFAFLDGNDGVEGYVADLMLAEIRALDAAFCFEPGGYRDCEVPIATDAYPYRGVRTGAVAPPAGYDASWFAVPTLTEVLDTFPGVPLNVEIKATGNVQIDQRAAALVSAVLTAADRTNDVVVVSFDDGIVAGFKLANPDINTAPGLGQGAAFVATSQGPGAGIPEFAGLHRVLQLPVTTLGISVVTEDLVRDAHADNLAVHVFTIDQADQMVRLVRMGVDSIMTNRVELLEETLGALAYQTPAELIPACPAPNSDALDGGCNLIAFAPGAFSSPN